jgi:hypothetical protein
MRTITYTATIVIEVDDEVDAAEALDDYIGSTDIAGAFEVIDIDEQP